MKKPNVAVVTPGTFSIPSFQNSSVERVVMNISRILNDDVHFIIFGKKAKDLPFYHKENGITYIRTYYRNQTNYLKKAGQQLAKCNPAIIQVENRPRFARFFKKRFPGKQVWLCLHSITFFSPPNIHSKELVDCLKYTDKIFVNSAFLKKKLLAYAPNIADKVEVNYLGVDPQQFSPRWTEFGQRLRTELQQKLGYMDKKIILYAGRLLPIKGVHHLLKVMPTIIKHYPNTILVIVGSAYYGKNKITPYVSKLHQMGNTMPNHVRFIPFVQHNEIQRWFALADISVVPSSENEAFGLVNVEAMASGVPVIATNSGGMKEIIKHGQTGYLIDPEFIQEQLTTGILELFDNPEKCRLMGEASVQRVLEHFTWKHTANRFLSFYRS